MFLTGTAAEIIPVTSVDRQGDQDAAKPGPITGKLIQAFKDLVAKGRAGRLNSGVKFRTTMSWSL